MKWYIISFNKHLLIHVFNIICLLKSYYTLATEVHTKGTDMKRDEDLGLKKLTACIAVIALAIAYYLYNITYHIEN